MKTPTAVIVSPRPGSRAGGVEMHCGLVGDALRADGWDVVEVGPSVDPTRWQHRIGAEPFVVSRSAMRAVPRGCDLVVSNGTLGHGGHRAATRVHVYHGTMVEHTRRGERDLGLAARWRRIAAFGGAEALAGRKATLRAAVSSSAAAEATRLYRLRIDRVIPLAVDTVRFRPRDAAMARRHLGLPQTGRIALSVGRVEHRKGSDLLLPAVRAAGGEWQLVVAGADRFPGALALGHLGHDELPWAYAAADAVLFPSRYEGFGYVAVEGLACGVPVVTTPTGWAAGIANRVPGYRPLVVEPAVGALARALRAAVGPGTAGPTAEVAAIVRAEHSMASFHRRWQELGRWAAGRR